MEDFIFRSATAGDVPFLVETIMEAEKSGTDILTYTTIFGLSEAETRMYLSEMLLEGIDGCELSISSFLLAEKEGNILASVCAWIEGLEGIASSVLKGNLLNYTLPPKCMKHALTLNPIVRQLHIEYIPGTIQIGLVYVAPSFRGMNLAEILIDEQVKRLRMKTPSLNEIYVQVFGNNIPAIRAYEKAKFKIHHLQESSNEEIGKYMPYFTKILMKRELSA